MRTTRPCYAVVVMDDGAGRPMVCESPLDLPLEEVEKRAVRMQERYGPTQVVELPIRLAMETTRVAGDENKVMDVPKEIEF